MPILRDFHGTKLPGPIVNLSEQVAMDGAKMDQAKRPEGMPSVALQVDQNGP